ncbi:Mediator of RNA polymerase II transcription subunit 29 [Dermatophagoides farinae]|uniref:Mediator of RNA polymerase II transcription subunit 29 n=1 Tax=Dermatophagoides farinae TaxID=6954 RepID=A0A922HZV1_DERFA|nr:Mediator of RNA polymerase II transcription subunit 29 [Dermatophagoides farinae]
MNPNQVNSNMMVGPGNIPPTQVSNTASPHQILPNPSASHPPQPPPQTSSHQMSNTHHDLHRLKNLISMLRETLRNFFIISGMNLDYSTQIDNFNKNLEQPPKLEKSLEDILALCNQIELCLRTILECTIQSRDSKTYLPFQVSNEFSLEQPTMMPDNSQPKSYASYLNVIKKQVTYAKSIYEILSESVKQIKTTPEPMIPSQIHHSTQVQMQPMPHQTSKLPPQLPTHP